MADAQHIVALPMAQRCACGCGKPTTRGVAKPFLQAHEPSVTAEALTNALLAALAIGELTGSTREIRKLISLCLPESGPNS